MIKVLMLAPYPPQETTIKGGVEAVTFNLINGFKNIENIEIQVISIRNDIDHEDVLQVDDHLKVIFMPFGYFRSTKVELLTHGRKRVKEIIAETQPDIVHLQGNGSALLLTIGIPEKSLIITQHGILEEEIKYQRSIYTKLNKLISLIIERILNVGKSNFIFISNYNKNLIPEAKLEHLLYQVIFNPVNPAFFNLINPISPNKILYVGGIMRRKGLLDLITVINCLQEVGIIYDLDIVGGVTDTSYKAEIDLYLQRHCLLDQIHFHGWLSQQEIIEIMRSNPLFVLPSYQETLPVSVAEALAANRVVVATDVGGVSEMFEEGSSGFLYEKGQVNDLEDILKLLYENEQLREKISTRAGETARKKFHPSYVAIETKNYYNELLAKLI
ncbi:MAG: glycosyltransferase family 4 protein [Bacteroidales bacterium]|nr:glycosyltransferase family 4 protein [Bacteroidales bacterium]